MSDDLASALALLAAEYAPLPLSTAPFINVEQRAAEARERRRVRRARLAKLGLAAVAAVGVLHLIVSVALFRQPADDVLQTEVAKTAQAVVLLHSSGARPLEIARAVPVLREKIDARHLRYYAEITLRLREPLYGPAQTNGTVAYRNLQESLERAREQELKFKFLLQTDGLAPPEMPRLITLLHRAGEPITVRVPFDAEKFGWRWLIKPAQFANRTIDRKFEGATVGHYRDAPYLIFGTPETMPDIRARMKAAREFVMAISREVQRRADVQAVAEPPPAEPAVAGNAGTSPLPSATPPPLFDPFKPAENPENPPKPEQPPGPLR